MSLPAETQVLVVGAGPSGLASAIVMASLGLQVVIVDSKATNANGSRAAVIHSQVLEAMTPHGLAQPIIDAGIISPGERVLGSTNRLMDIDVSVLSPDTPYPYSVLIAQDTVENIFLEKIEREKITLVRNKKVVGIRAVDDYHGVEVTCEDGSTIRAQYVVGADGSRSVVRDLSGIEFKDTRTGRTYDESKPDFNMVLADAFLQEPLHPAIARNRISLHLDNFLVMVPQPFPKSSPISKESSSYWRIGYSLPPDGVPPHNPSLEFFEQELNKRSPWGTKLTVQAITASSRYRVRYAVATKYFAKMGNGIILLAGDAAHVHSPAGGQGVNTGICDGVAAAHAIHAHLATPKDAILQKFSDIRREIGSNTVNFTRGITDLVDNSWRKHLRDLWVRITIGSIPFLNKRQAQMLSGVAHRKIIARG